MASLAHRTPSAVVIGAGPNGLSAAVHLAKSGVAVTVLEEQPEIGGGARSGPIDGDGLIHDRCSAVHPLGAASPFFLELDLQRHGLRWCWPEIDCAHPLTNSPTGLLYRDIGATVEALGADGPQWRRLFGPLASRFGELAPDVLGPVLRIPKHPLLFAKFGLRAGLPATALARMFSTPTARALFAGIAAHPFVRLDRPLTAAAAAMLIAAGHHSGWPVAEGGSGAITLALAAELRAQGGLIHPGVAVRAATDIPSADLVLLDLTPRQALALYHPSMPGYIRRSFSRFRYGATAFKVDFAIDGDIGWNDRQCARAGTVHLGGDLHEIGEAERDRIRGVLPRKPFVLVAQQYLADPSRSAGSVHPVWAYAHVPRGFTGNATELLISRIEEFAAGFTEQIISVTATSTAELQAHNSNYIDGDIAGGSNAGLQLLFRPRLGLDPYSLGIAGVYLCSQSTPPGAGVHGMPGFAAAASALRYLARRSNQ